MNFFSSSFPASLPPSTKITNRLLLVYWTPNFIGCQMSTTCSLQVSLRSLSTLPEHLAAVLNVSPNIPILTVRVYTGIVWTLLGTLCRFTILNLSHRRQVLDGDRHVISVYIASTGTMRFRLGMGPMDDAKIINKKGRRIFLSEIHAKIKVLHT